jgi:DNA-binding transcriptional regulator YiaG
MAAFKYGCYRTIKQLRQSVALGAAECARVLQADGKMIFKWSNSEKPYSWATDTVEKAAPTLFKDRLKVVRSGAHSKNQTMYVWYLKRDVPLERGPG